jgi:hypothetical protein
VSLFQQYRADLNRVFIMQQFRKKDIRDIFTIDVSLFRVDYAAAVRPYGLLGLSPT